MKDTMAEKRTSGRPGRVQIESRGRGLPTAAESASGFESRPDRIVDDLGHTGLKSTISPSQAHRVVFVNLFI